MFYLLVSAVFIAANCQPPIITTSPEYLCLGDSVQLNCSAEGSATWTSDDILGPGQAISFTESSQNQQETLGNVTGVLIKTSPRIVTSLSFNLANDRVETSCNDRLLRTTTTISSVQPSPNHNFSVDISYSKSISGGNLTWRPPSNIDDFLLREYQLMVECNGTVVIVESVAETTYRYDAGRLIPGLCNATVRVINSCGDTASNSISFGVVLVGGNNTVVREGENENTTGFPTITKEDEDSNNIIWIIIGTVGGLIVGGLLVVMGILIILWSCNKLCKIKK